MTFLKENIRFGIEKSLYHQQVLLRGLEDGKRRWHIALHVALHIPEPCTGRSLKLVCGDFIPPRSLQQSPEGMRLM